MKKIFALIMAVVLTAGCAMAQDNTSEIPAKKVPDLGLRMVKAYFPENTIAKAVKYNSKDQKNRTAVFLDNGATIDFDKDGNWMRVDCSDSAVPQRMVPGKILMYLNANHPGAQVKLMSREIKNGDIKIVLADGTELRFTNEQTIIK